MNRFCLIKRKTILETYQLLLFESEFYSAAAIKHKKTGQVITGTWHGETYQKAMDLHGQYDPEDWEDGFVRNDRKPHHEDWFETREQSRERFRSGESIRLGELGQLQNAKKWEDITATRWDLRPKTSQK